MERHQRLRLPVSMRISRGRQRNVDMARLATIVGALALTCSFAATAQTPYQSGVAPTVQDPAAEESISNCGPRDEIVAQLGSVFQEAPSGMGMIDPNAVVEVFVSDAGTFTILASNTDGTSCILASGEGWDGGAVKQVGNGA
jgi:hypothetical protein